MSRAKAQRLLSEILTLFDGPHSLAVQGLIAVLAGRGLLLAPRGHHFENLANAVAWSFNGVIRKITNGAPLDAATLMEGGQLPHVLLLEGVDSARLVKLRATLRKLTEPDQPKPDLLFFLATADPAEIPSLGHPDRAVWDELFGLRVNGRDSVQRGPTVLADLEPDTLGVEAILPEDILELRRDVAAVPLQANLESALERIPTLLIAEGWSRLPPSAPQDLSIAARAVAFLRGKPEVNLSHVADVLHPALTARLNSGDSSSAELLDAVEIVWDEAAGQGDSDHPRVPQRKTFVGVEGGLEGAIPRSGDASAPGEETLADASTDPLVTAPVLASPKAGPKTPPTVSPSEVAEEGDTWVGSEPAVPTVARPRHGKDAAEEAPQAIHDAYYVPQASYKAPTFGAEAGREESADAHLPERVAKAPPKGRSWWPTLVSASLLGAIAFLGTTLFPNWPFQLYGVGMAISAQGKLWAGQYADAQTTALAALEKLGPRNPLAQRVETIAFLARHELVEQNRNDRETAAREAYQMRHFEEAGAAFDALAREFPDHPRYSQLAAQARRAEAARGSGQSEPAALSTESAGGETDANRRSGTPQTPSADQVNTTSSQTQSAESTQKASGAQSVGTATAPETPGAATPVQ